MSITCLVCVDLCSRATTLCSRLSSLPAPFQSSSLSSPLPTIERCHTPPARSAWLGGHRPHYRSRPRRSGPTPCSCGRHRRGIPAARRQRRAHLSRAFEHAHTPTALRPSTHAPPHSARACAVTAAASTLNAAPPCPLPHPPPQPRSTLPTVDMRRQACTTPPPPHRHRLAAAASAAPPAVPAACLLRRASVPSLLCGRWRWKRSALPLQAVETSRD